MSKNDKKNPLDLFVDMFIDTAIQVDDEETRKAHIEAAHVRARRSSRAPQVEREV